MRVGILEDQKLMRETLEDAVRAIGYEVACSTPDPEAFLTTVRDGGIDLALVDLWLGGDQGKLKDSGWDAFTQLREWHSDVRVLVLTGIDTARVDDCLAAGASGFVDKNITSLAVLRDAIVAVAEGARVAPVLPSVLGAVSSPPTRKLPALTERELDILRLVAAGDDNLKISAQLGISERTVRAHISSLYKKLSVENRAQMAIAARTMGVLPPRS